MVYPDNIESKIDFTTIRRMVAGACRSTLGRERVEAMTFLTEAAAIRALLAETDELRRIYEDPALGFPRGEINDLREALARIRVEGLYLDEAELFSLRKTLDYAYQLERFFRNLDGARFPIWAGDSGYSRDSGESSLSGNSSLSGIDAIVRTIDRVLDKYGQLSDSASPELARIRHDLTAAQGSVGRALTAILRKAQADGLLDKDVTPTLREGRLVIPVPPMYKRKIGGIVHDESATGKTVYVEPQQVVEANNRIRELEGEERRERIRILQEVSAHLRPEIPTIIEAESMLGHVDFVSAKVHLMRELKAICPAITDDPLIDLREARHPVLYLNFKKQDKTVVPLTLRLSDKRILIISGPNAGGKSVCLKTVALLQYMLQCGLPVPLNEASCMGVFERLMIDIGDEQSIEDDLSTYSSHLRNMKAFVRNANARTLFLIDEFGTGTEPLLGGAIAEAVLSDLTAAGAFGVITTHYTNLKHFAEQTEGVINGAMLYDRGQLRPLFQLSIGQAGSSFAIEIARQIGLPETIIARATELVGEEHIEYDKQLQDIARDKRYWANKREAIRQREKHLEEKIAYYEGEISTLKQKRKVMLAEAQAEAAELLRESNATIERTIREIKEAKAEKQKTRAAREKVENLKSRVQEGLGGSTQGVDRTRIVPDKAPRKDSQRARKEQKVLHDFRDLKPIAKQMPSAQPSVVNTIRSRKLSFSRTLDLRGLRADEALETFIAYIDDAIMVDAGEVTILHGTGTGAIKQIVRDYLAQYNKRRPNAKLQYGDGDPDRGGAGITIIEI